MKQTNPNESHQALTIAIEHFADYLAKTYSLNTEQSTYMSAAAIKNYPTLIEQNPELKQNFAAIANFVKAYRITMNQPCPKSKN
jgi:hypothetical protein